MGKPLDQLDGAHDDAGDGQATLAQQASVAKAWVRRIDDLLETVTYTPVLEILESIRKQVASTQRITPGQQVVITRAEDRQDRPQPKRGGSRRYEGYGGW